MALDLAHVRQVGRFPDAAPFILARLRSLEGRVRHHRQPGRILLLEASEVDRQTRRTLEA